MPPQLESPFGPIKSLITDEGGSTRIDLTISDAHGDIARYGGFIDSREPEVVTPQGLTVQPEFRGYGIGEQLVRELAAQAKEHGAKTIRGHIESEYALDIRARIFGPAALRFYKDAYTAPLDYSAESRIELPITFEQARQSLVRAREFEEDLEFRDHGFDVEVDIT